MNAANNDLEVISANDLGIKLPRAKTTAAKTFSVTERFGNQVYGIELCKGASVRMFGTYENRATPRAFDITFKVGDSAVYGSYNLTYTGTIVSIGEKVITVEERHGGRRHRLPLSKFAWSNWDYDAKAIAKRNSEWCD